MELQTFCKNIDLNDEAQRYIQKKMDRLTRHLSSLSDGKLEVSRTSSRSEADRVVAQLTLTAGGRVLRTQESGLNLFAAIDAIADVMDRQIRRYKGKFYRTSQGKRSARTSARQSLPAPEVEEHDPESEALELGAVVRTKVFPMPPMSVEDAILQMEMLSHDFFMFFNSDSDEYSVVYRRRDGGYSLIAPEPA